MLFQFSGGSHLLQHYSAIRRLEQFNTKSVGGGKISSYSTDYRNIEIPQDSVIYCDIPYMGTNEYTGVPIFDYEAFYDWAESQMQPLFISSYDMPRDRFRCVAEFKHNSTLSASSVVPVVERVFVPIKQEHKTIRQLSLFD
jgi:site-specific DNA-adenine methylase